MNTKKPLYQVLARMIAWTPPADSEFGAQREAEIKRCLSGLPSGAGWTQQGCVFTDNKIVLYGAYHHMSDNGFYDGWTEHTITVQPDLANGFTLTISGRDRNDIKEYLYELFDCALREPIDTWATAPTTTE